MVFGGQTIEQARAVGRKERQFWYVFLDEPPYGVKEVTGFEAHNDGYWWCPEVGMSAHEGTTLFADEEKAKSVLRGVLGKQRDEIDAILKKLGS